MKAVNWRKMRTRTRAAVGVLVVSCTLAAILVVPSGCGTDGGTGGGSSVVLDKQGKIEAGDARDPNHSNLPYDGYTFDADLRDVVVIEVEAEGFVPLLKLVEVATGAPLAEWEEQYSDDDALTYTIAGPGEYEARVYALEQGSGTYAVTVRLNP